MKQAGTRQSAGPASHRTLDHRPGVDGRQQRPTAGGRRPGAGELST